jgi:hypothetical protein
MSSKTITFTNQKTETFFERHAWKVLLFFSVFMALIGLPDILVGGSFYQEAEGTLLEAITGMTWEQLEAASPNATAMIDLKLRIGGVQFLFLGLFSIAIALTGFRRGERWAWYTMWLYPLFLGLHSLVILSAYKHPEAGIPVPLVSGPVVLVITALTLALSYRKFFPK